MESRDTKLPAALEVQVHLGGVPGPDVTWGRGVSQAPPQPALELRISRPIAGFPHGPEVDDEPLEPGPGQVGALVVGRVVVGLEDSLQAGLHHEHLGL